MTVDVTRCDTLKYARLHRPASSPVSIGLDLSFICNCSKKAVEFTVTFAGSLGVRFRVTHWTPLETMITCCLCGHFHCPCPALPAAGYAQLASLAVFQCANAIEVGGGGEVRQDSDFPVDQCNNNIMCSFLCHFSFGAQGPLHETN